MYHVILHLFVIFVSCYIYIYFNQQGSKLLILIHGLPQYISIDPSGLSLCDWMEQGLDEWEDCISDNNADSGDGNCDKTSCLIKYS